MNACLTSIFAGVAIGLIIQATLSDGNTYSLGHSFGKQLRETDDDLDLKDLDIEIQTFAEQLGSDQRIVGKLVNDDFREGTQHGYYWKEYQEELLNEIGGQVGGTGG